MFPDSNLFTLSNLSLLIQILAFLLLLYVIQMTRGSMVKHGKLSGTAFSTWLCLQYFICFIVRARGLTLAYYKSLLNLHILLGILSILLGILFVTNRWKWKGKKYMDLGTFLWTGTFLLGIAIYLLLFGIISP